MEKWGWRSGDGEVGYDGDVRVLTPLPLYPLLNSTDSELLNSIDMFQWHFHMGFWWDLNLQPSFVLDKV